MVDVRAGGGVSPEKSTSPAFKQGEEGGGV